MQIIDIPATTTSYAAAGTAPPPGRYEAENGTISQGVVESDHAGFSGPNLHYLDVSADG